MLNSEQALIAVRNRLLTGNFATTGTTTLGATGKTYTRPAGSFVDDGFREGMEVVPVGFAETDPVLVTYVEDQVLTVLDDRTTEVEAGSRSLTVGIPSLRIWDNVSKEPLDNRWYLEEDWITGPRSKFGLGQGARVETLPIYVAKLGIVTGFGSSAYLTVCDAILDLFPPNYSMNLADSTVLRVRSEPGPYYESPVPLEAGRAVVTITIPLIAFTNNSI